MKYNVEMLKAVRERQLMSITELSELSGVPISTIGAIENGRGATWKKPIRRIAAILKVDVVEDEDSGRKRRSA